MNDPGNSDRASARFRAVAQIAEDLEALVRLFREQGVAHPDLPKVRQELHTQLFIYLQIHDMLAIDLVGGELSFEGQTLPASRRLARPLHRVGVRQLVLESGLEPGELIALTNAWTTAVEQPESNFVSDLESFDLDHIWLTLAGPGSISAPPADEPQLPSDPPPIELASEPPPRPGTAQRSARRLASASVASDFELDAPAREPEPARDSRPRRAARSAPRRVERASRPRSESTAPEPSAAQPSAAQPSASIPAAPEAPAAQAPAPSSPRASDGEYDSPSQNEAGDGGRPPMPSAPEGSFPGGLSPEDAGRLRDTIAGDNPSAAQAAMAQLMVAAGPAPDAKRLQVARLMKQGLASLAERGRFDLLLSAYQLEVPEDAFDPRPQLLADPELLGPALDALERFPSDELSLLLAQAPAEASRAIIERALRQPRGPVREVMKHLLFTIPVPGEVLTDALQYADDDLGELFLHMAGRDTEGVPQRFWHQALEHHHAAVRSATLARMAHDHYDALCELIYPLLADPDRTIRRAALDLIMRRHDVRAAPFLAVRIEAREIPVEELHSVIVALGRLGTADASRALREQFDQRRDAKIKAAILLALTQVEGEGARELLQKHAEKRFFSNRQVRDAAEQGLKRLDAKLAGRKFRPTPWEDGGRSPSGFPPAAPASHAPASMGAPPGGPVSQAPASFAPPQAAPAPPHARLGPASQAPPASMASAPAPPSHMPPAKASYPPAVSASYPPSVPADHAPSAPPRSPAPAAGSELELDLELEDSPRRQTVTEPGESAAVVSARRSRRTEDAPTDGSASVPPARSEAVPSERSRPPRQRITSKPAMASQGAKKKRDTTHRKITNHSMAAVDANTVDRVDMRRLRRLSSHHALRAEGGPTEEAPRRKRSRSNEGPAFARTAKRLLAGGAVDEALAVLEDAKQEHADHPDLFALIATVYEQRDQLSAAVDALHEAVLLAPDRSDLAERLYALREREVGQR